MKKRTIFATFFMVTLFSVPAMAETDIGDFEYEIQNNKIVLDSYEGKDDIIEIAASYVVDGIEYAVDMSEFQVGIGNDDIKTVILDEGITEVYDAIFNSSDVEVVFFPKSMEIVFDKTLSYLHPEEDDEYIQIYYAGTEDEWNKIFTKYERTEVGDAESAEEVGASLADFLNGLIGSGYDESEFEYHFEATLDDLQ